MNMVNYRLVPTSGKLPEPVGLYEYCLASNGVFVRAKREGLYACIPVARANVPGIRGLGELAPVVRLESGRVNLSLLAEIRSRAAAISPLEALWWLKPDANNRWTACQPSQTCTPGSVRPDDPYDPFGASALIDIHSHNEMKAFFSSQDDVDEKSGLRIYCVLGRVSQPRLEILCRVGVYGHFYYISPNRVFGLEPYVSVAGGDEYDYVQRTQY